MPTNTVLIMVDQQKATSLPMYGNPIVRTPNLDALAQESCLFRQAHTSCPLCVPARVSTFTGQYPSTHGSLNNSILMKSGASHLLGLLKEAGYTIGLAGKNHCFREEDMPVFDYLEEAGHYGPTSASAGPSQKAATQYLHACEALRGAWGWAINPHPPEALGTAWVTDKAIAFLDQHGHDPFFLWYSIPDPHIPFQTCEPYASMYPPEAVDLPSFKADEMTSKPRAQQIDHEVMCGNQVDEETIRHLISIYYGMNTFIDTEIGRFLAALSKRGLDQDTLVIYVSDHGEYLGEHRMIRKSKAAYDCLTHVPLIIRAPGMKPQPHDTLVSLEDLMPTVLSYTGLDIPDTVQGRDLRPLLEGRSFEDRDYVYGEYGGHPYPIPANQPYETCAAPLSPDFRPAMKLGGYGKMRYLRTPRWKLVMYVQDTTELYDLNNDPLEVANLHNTPGTETVVSELKSMMIEHMMATNHMGADVGMVS
jgi:arylsulfatase